MDTAHRLVWDLIRRRTGSDSAITRADLCEATGIHDRRVRQIVSELVTEHNFLIVAAATGGYYVTDASADRAAYARREISKAIHNLDRAEKIAGPQVFLENAGQVRLMLQGAESAQAVRDEQPVPMAPQGADLPCTAIPGPESTEKLTPGQRPSDGEPNGLRCRICSTPLHGRQTVACSEFHRQLLNGRQKAS